VVSVILAGSLAWTALPGCGGSGAAARGESLRVTSYNVLLSVPIAGFDPWPVRRDAIVAALRRADPDLVGLQEPLPNQVADLLAGLPGYASARLPVNTDSTILYRERRFELLERGAFWLSPTPDRPWSRGFGNDLPRNALWVRLRDRHTGRELAFANTHFDNTSPFQEHAAPVFLERTASLADAGPLVVAGDFNSRPGSAAFALLTGGSPYRLDDTFRLAEDVAVLRDESDTRPFDAEDRIDHVFVHGDGWRVERWSEDRARFGDPPRDASDHFPVTARLRLPAG